LFHQFVVKLSRELAVLFLLPLEIEYGWLTIMLEDGWSMCTTHLTADNGGGLGSADLAGGVT